MAAPFCSVRRRVVLFGGWDLAGATKYLGDTWNFGPDYPARYDGFGAGCAGSPGVPSLAAAAGDLPWVGEVFSMQAGPLAPNTGVFLVFGGSREMWGAQMRPFRLGSIGMTGCALHVSLDVAVGGAADASGVASFEVPVPLAVELLGVEWHNQLFAIDSGANPRNLIVSNAATARIGAP